MTNSSRHRAWRHAVAGAEAAERAYYAIEGNGDETAAAVAFQVCSAARERLWTASPPDLAALAAKLELAMEWLGEKAPPLARVLEDLRKFAGATR